MSDSMIFVRSINAPAAAVYHAWTNAMALREWLCDGGQVDARVGGSLLLSWRIGYTMMGEYTVLEPGQKVAFTWMGKGEPGATQVEVTLKPDGSGTQVEVTHSGVGSGEAWDAVRQQMNDGWNESLENLQSILETGLDQRIMRRPMLGIYPSPLTAESAAKLRVPVREGTHITGVVDGLGAKAAGLQTDDVLVSLGGYAINDYPSMAAALSHFRGGDTVAIVFYRGPEKYEANMTLSKRPEPEMPESAAALAEKIKAGQAQVEAELDQLLNGVPEQALSQRPVPDEWSANENLAHLIWSERFSHMGLWGAAGGDDSIPWPDNGPLHLVGTLAAYPTSAELVAELKRAHAATAAMAAALPESFMQRKGSLRTIAQSLIATPVHTRQHFDQMRRAIEALKQAQLQPN